MHGVKRVIVFCLMTAILPGKKDSIFVLFGIERPYRLDKGQQVGYFENMRAACP